MLLRTSLAVLGQACARNVDAAERPCFRVKKLRPYDRGIVPLSAAALMPRTDGLIATMYETPLAPTVFSIYAQKKHNENQAL